MNVPIDSYALVKNHRKRTYREFLKHQRGKKNGEFLNAQSAFKSPNCGEKLRREELWKHPQRRQATLGKVLHIRMTTIPNSNANKLRKCSQLAHN